MKKTQKNHSSTPTFIIIGSIIMMFALANPMPLVSAILFVWIFSDKFGKKYRK